MLPTSIPKLRMKIRMYHSLLETLMDIPSLGGLMETTAECREIDNLLSSLGPSQLISKPTNFVPNKNPSCICLVITYQPNLVLDSGTRASLDSFRHHHITYCTVNFNIPPPFERRIWHDHRADTTLLKRSMCRFPWVQHLNTNQDPNWQVKTFTKLFMNIMTNFIPNEIKRIVPRDPPWITIYVSQ